MKEHPILFSSEMVRAILDGRKTKTRRIVKFTPQPAIEAPVVDGLDEVHGTLFWHVGTNRLQTRCPYGAEGDRLWVRETVGFVRDGEHDREAFLRGSGAPKAIDGWTPRYRADGLPPNTVESGFPWWPGIHMPRWASRLTLEITSVRVERLHAITESDAKAEGVDAYSGSPIYEGLKSHREGFAALWDGINGKRAPWASNPWVWAIGFQRVAA